MVPEIQQRSNDGAAAPKGVREGVRKDVGEEVRKDAPKGVRTGVWQELRRSCERVAKDHSQETIEASSRAQT